MIKLILGLVLLAAVSQATGKEIFFGGKERYKNVVDYMVYIFFKIDLD